MGKSEAIKQVIIVRTDLKMGKGKSIAQGCHASVNATLKAISMKKPWFDKWEREGAKKVVCKVQSEKELNELFQFAREMELPSAIINDAGHTQLPPGTTTAVAIGPGPEKKVDAITGELKLL